MTVEQENKILELYKELNSTNKTAQEMGCSRPTVASVLKKHGVLNRNQQNDTEAFREAVIKAYTEDMMNTNEIKEKFHIGKPKIKKILQSKGIEFRKEKRNSKRRNFEYGINKYPSLEGTSQSYLIEGNGLRYKCKNIKKSYITKFCKDNNLVVPSNKYQAREEFCKDGNYWWEKYFTVTVTDDITKKQCPYCDWSIEMDGNWKLAFIMHVQNKHNIKKEQFLKDFPNEIDTFKTKYDEHFYTENGYVTCAICGKKMKRLDNLHLKLHGITKLEYLTKYNSELLSKDTYEKLHNNYISMRKYIDEHPEVVRNTKPELEIKDFILSLGIDDIKSDRSILSNFKELDIYSPSHRFAVEFNGCYWHSEKFKEKNYHLDKLIECQNKGIKLIQIFEDEYATSKNVVYSKIKHALGCDYDLPKIMGRKCIIKEINNQEAEGFLNEYHIQHFASASVYLGAYHEDELIGVLTCIKRDKEWDLNRLATNYNYRCQGVASKLFKTFVRKYNPTLIKSFADRRWTINENENVYINLGFKLDKILPPDYRYFSPRLSHYKRFHKFGFRKDKLSKEYGLPIEMSETEMIKKLGIERIWDCGLLKYVWSK